MLTIGKLGTGQERYYLDKIVKGAEDYYSGEGEVAGQWMGDAAADLGLSGEVGADQLTAMLTGCNPVDGSPLGLRAVGGRGPVPGFDLTFSAPKSVSLLWGLGGIHAALEVNEAHQASVEVALDYMQREACWTRRGAGGAEFVPGNGYLAAAYVHRSSRAGDPQLHTHVLIANATKGPDGRWTRLYHPAIYDHAKTASYIYEANLRHELTQRLGVEWQPVRKGFAEIEGFADEHLREFSTRRAEILEAAGADASARSRQVAALTTRGAKEQGISREELIERWRNRANEIGLDKEAVERTFDPEAFRVPQAPADDRTVSTRQVDRAVTSGASHFDRRDAIQAVADSLPAGAPGAEVERLADAYLASDSVISLGESAKGERFTTQHIWELERTALDTAAKMRAEGPGAAGELVATRVIGKRPTLKDDQREMVRRLLVDSEGVVVVIGEAGTGKSYATAAAAEGWGDAGMELRAGAPTWRAANVLRAEGLPASSVASLLADLDRAARASSAALPRGSVLLIDEAGMVDSATLARLIAHANAAEAKLVLIGDPEQLGEIEAGGLFRAVSDRPAPIYLDEVIRHQHEAERQGAKLIREGEGAEAIDLYRSEERVVVAANPQLRREAMVADWHEAFAGGEDAVMVAKRNVEVERLNEMARQMRQEAGKLGAAEIEVGEARFAAGDQVITRVNGHAAQIYNRERWQVEAVDTECQKVVLRGIDQPRQVELDAGYLTRTNPYNDAPALEHAYAVTTYSAQGTTVDRAFVMADPSMDKQEMYVATSRSRGETYLYVTPEVQTERDEFAPRSPHLREGLPHIAEAAERDRSQLAAHDEALRTELRRLPTQEIVARRAELHDEVMREGRVRTDHIEEGPLIHVLEGQYEVAVDRRDAVEAGGWRQRRRELPDALEREASCHEALERKRAVAERNGPLTDTATREDAIAGQVLAERRELAITAARIAPPAYITSELGERPSDPAKCKSWEKGVETVERYRLEHGVKDPNHALGRDSGRSGERAREQAQQRLRESQRELGRIKEAAQVRDMGRSIGIGL
ncbi:MAG: relaxase domain-containing protein [Solirubrobacterales bacterium]|nr:relaxase domain-containing protein [Solirubrobacterales bacterium]